MSIKIIEQDFINKVSEQIQLSPDGKERFRVFTPFIFEDGDHLVIVLKKDGERWILSDEAHTYMHLTYNIDEKLLHSGKRKKIISKALSIFEVEDRGGELILDISERDYGEALYDFAQALLKITDISYLPLPRERVQSTFMDDFRSLLREVVPQDQRYFDWHHPIHDRERKYTVNCRINGTDKPLFVYALSNNDRIRDATIKLQKVRQWNIPFRPLGIFQDRDVANRQVVARFDDVCEVYFPSLEADRQEIVDYLGENIQNVIAP